MNNLANKNYLFVFALVIVTVIPIEMTAPVCLFSSFCCIYFASNLSCQHHLVDCDSEEEDGSHDSFE